MKPRVLLSLLMSGLALSPLLVACGASSSMPDPPSCALDSSTPPVGSPPRGPQEAARQYLGSLQTTWSGLQSLYLDFKSAYPTNSFSRDSEFRPAAAKFIDYSICHAKIFLAMQPPSARLQERYGPLYPLLDDYVAHLQAGRDAVRTRNVTEYHAFYDELERKMDAIRRASVG